MNAELIDSLKNNEALVRFINGVNQLIVEGWQAARLTYNDPPVVMVENVGRRYARLAVFEKMPYKTGPLVAKSVYCFFDHTTGDLLKGSWKAPVANGVRGNLSDPDVLLKFTQYGPKYLR
jgi:hypothetical protein